MITEIFLRMDEKLFQKLVTLVSPLIEKLLAVQEY